MLSQLTVLPYVPVYGLYTRLHNYTGKVQPLPLVEKRTMPALYSMGPLLYCYLEILPELKACCPGTKAKLTRRIDSCRQPISVSSFDLIKVTIGMKLWMNKGKLSGRRYIYHPKLGSFQCREVLSCLPCWKKILWFQSSRLCSMHGKKKKERERERVSEREITARECSFRQNHLLSNAKAHVIFEEHTILSITQCMHFHPHENCGYPSTHLAYYKMA